MLFGRINKSLLAATVLLGLPETSTEADLVTAATNELSKKVDRLEASVKADKAVVDAAEKERETQIKRVENECDAKTQGPKAKIAKAIADEQALTAVYTKLTK